MSRSLVKEAGMRERERQKQFQSCVLAFRKHLGLSVCDTENAEWERKKVGSI